MQHSDSLPVIRPDIVRLADSRIREVAHFGMKLGGVTPLWFGEPDLPTPDFICEAAAEALKAGHVFYTESAGVPGLRQALADYLTPLNGRPIHADRIVVTASGMNAIQIVMQSLVDYGTNVVTTSPLWPNCGETVRIMGGEVRPVELTMGNDGWQLDIEKLMAACDGNTRALFVNSPNNPTGWVMPSEQQKQLLDFAREKGIWIVADEVYDRMVYEGNRAPSFLEVAGDEDPVLVINSFSKSWSMTGWRMGWITAPLGIIPTLLKMNEFNTASAATFAQHAGIVAVRQGEGFIAQSVARYREGRDIVYDRLSQHPRIRMVQPKGAFYHFFAVDGMDDSMAFAKRLVAEQRVGLAPGSAFGPGGEGHLRLCFASSPATLHSCLDRIEALLG
ncbi:pyridoxal phosphate-dependent aminotransferase [Oceanibaculum pacificum]|uniref:Aminotransferase n=1 Tax=Oceanibaculum pacificum TaxID=580166 RepID=A0A154W964_9PROT|nr:pyridoxal phosphate-dependent aminotransferase [Oceanibaculum pacificum]KZD10025.1 aspartate aminotransferase [Oceanibaculum pacificum]